MLNCTSNSKQINPTYSGTTSNAGGSGDVSSVANTPSAGSVPVFSDATGKKIDKSLVSITEGFGLAYLNGVHTMNLAVVNTTNTNTHNLTATNDIIASNQVVAPHIYSSGNIHGVGEVKGGTLKAIGNLTAVEGSFSGNLATSTNLTSVNATVSNNCFTNNLKTNGITGNAYGRVDVNQPCLVRSNTPTQQGLPVQHDGTQFSCLSLNDTRSDGAPSVCARFERNGVTVGSIATSTNSTAYFTTSDYRLKKNTQPLVGATAKIKQLQPKAYQWKANNQADVGFLAHELQEVCPLAVSGMKDGKEFQQVDLSKLVPLLVGAVQELTSRLEKLEKAQPVKTFKQLVEEANSL